MRHPLPETFDTEDALAPLVGHRASPWRRLRRERLALAGLLLVLAFVAMALAAPHLAPHPPNQPFDNGISDDGAPLPPGAHGFPLGTDPSGRDLLSRLIWGARVSLLIGIVANAIAVLIGAMLGALIFGTVEMGIFYTGIDTDWFMVFLGLMVVLAVLFNNFIRRKATEAR